MNRIHVFLLSACMTMCVMAGMPRSSYFQLNQAAITATEQAKVLGDSVNQFNRYSASHLVKPLWFLVVEDFSSASVGYFGHVLEPKGKVPRRPIQNLAPVTNTYTPAPPNSGVRISNYPGNTSPSGDAGTKSAVMRQIGQTNAPKAMTKQRNVLPGPRVLERSTRPVSFNAPIVDQPAGEVKTYLRSGMAIYQDDTSVYQGEQSGVVTVVVDGNTYWFKNLLYDPNNAFPEYWIQGTKSGDKINIDLPQDIDDQTYASYGITIKMVWGATRVSGQNISLTPNVNADASFTVAADGTLTLDNATYSDNWVGNGLNAYMSYYGTNYYQGATIFTTTLTPLGDVPEAPEMYTDDDIDAMEGELVTYNRLGRSIYATYSENATDLELGEQSGYGNVFYDSDGVTVYMRNPVYGWQNNMWIKGTRDGNVLSFPLGQYIAWEEYIFGLKTSWGTFVNGTGFFADPDVTDVTFTIDGDYISMNNCGVVDEDNTFVGMALTLDSAYFDCGWFGDIDFMTTFVAVPGIPSDVTVAPGSTSANVTWADEANSMWNIRYRECVEDAAVYINDFEAEVDLVGLVDWDKDGDGKRWRYKGTVDGNDFMASASYINDFGALSPDNWLLTPKIKLDGIVRFTAWGTDADDDNEVFKVYLFVGDTATIVNPEDDFIAISDDVVTTAENTVYTFEIPDEYKDQQGYVAIRHYNVSDQYWLAVDDFFVGDPDAVRDWITVNGLGQSAAVLEGLTPETPYELQVQSVNDGGVGKWSNSTVFTTLAPQPQSFIRGDVDGNGRVEMDDLTLLINFLLDPATEINYDNAAVCNSLTGDASELVDMDDLTALINMLLTNEW